MNSYLKGVTLSLSTTTMSVVPSLIFHEVSIRTAVGISLGITLVMTFVVWAKAWRYRWQPEVRERWFYLNFTSPAVVFLTIQAIGWPIFYEQKNTLIVPSAGIETAQIVAWLAAIAAITLWVTFSVFLSRKKPSR